MQIRISKCPDSKNFRPYVKRAVEFYGQELIKNKRLYNNIYVDIKFDSKIDAFGYASIEGYNTLGKPREFLIEVHPGISAKDILSTLAHEMVHVHQYATGLLTDVEKDITRWCGKKIDPDKLDYYSHPWEIEAHGKEIGLLAKFVVKEQLWNIFDKVNDPSAPITDKPLGWKNLVNK